MTEARPVLPTDLLTLAAFNGRLPPNEAWTRDRLGVNETANAFETALEQCLAFIKRRNAWISFRRQRLRGLIGVRQRGGRQAWEIDCLMDATSERDALPPLLEGMLSEAPGHDVEKVFLRLKANCDLMDSVREAGFLPYQNEVLYHGHISVPPSRQGLRLMTPADSYPVFRLYNLATPETVRRYEAATYGEWQAAQERAWQKGGAGLVRENNGRIEACVRAARLPRGIAVDLLATDSALEDAAGLIAAAVAVIGDAPVLVLVAENESLGRCLADAGLRPGERYVSLFQRTTRPISVPNLVPAAVKTALGA
jgi:hypothetical protein